MIFDKTKPITWTDVSLHPYFAEGAFQKEWWDADGVFLKDWWDGDIDKDLMLLRSACLMILESFSSYSCTLQIDDGCLMYVELYKGRQLIAELYPNHLSSGQRYLYFYLFNHPKGEVIVLTAEEAKEVVCAIERGDDLAEYPDTDDF